MNGAPERCLSNFVLAASSRWAVMAMHPETALDSLSFDKGIGVPSLRPQGRCVDASKQFAHKFDCVGNFQN